ncbi:hypothetical protein C8Q77DRAFT_367014 [Trametes polyzona]|nr:hypothetical protein C8Q77DRAFT_367014 [Trametes polyzona]
MVIPRPSVSSSTLIPCTGQHPVTYTIPRRMPRSPLHAGRCDPTRAEWTSQPRGHSHPATHPWHGLRRACTCRADSYRHIQRPWGAGMGVCPSRPMPIPLAATRTGVARPSNPTPMEGAHHPHTPAVCLRAHSTVASRA